MQTGELTVTGVGKTEIILRGHPRQVIVQFKSDPDPTPCNPHHHAHRHDFLHHKIDHEDEDKRTHHKLGHHHHDRQFILVIEWRVSGVREIDWFVFY